jgi:hypothetical protein
VNIDLVLLDEVEEQVERTLENIQPHLVIVDFHGRRGRGSVTRVRGEIFTGKLPVRWV